MSWLLGFSVSWFLGLLVSSFQSFRVPKIQGFINHLMFLEDIDPISPSFHFMLFWKILIPYPRFSRTYWTYLRNFLAPVFSIKIRMPGLQKIRFPNIICLKTIRDVSWIIWSILVSPKMNNIGFGSHGHVRKSPNHENEGLWALL